MQPESRSSAMRRKELKFVENGQLIVVRDADPRASLGDFLRDQLLLRGLKLVCRQGGCGSCTVVLSAPKSDEELNPIHLRHRPVNSCLRPLCSVDGMIITIVEGIGCSKSGLHPVQQSIVEKSGTQCGYCTPGFVMNMYGFLSESPAPAAEQVEDQLDGNICSSTRSTLKKPGFGSVEQHRSLIYAALELLQEELVVETNDEKAFMYRSSVIGAFFFKVLLSLWPKESVPKRFLSSVSQYLWPVTTGKVTFDKGDPAEYPVSKPFPKLSAITQLLSTGEAQYLEDLKFGDELHATYVLSTVGNAKIKSIDASKALVVKGVVKFISAQTLVDGGYNNNVSDFEQVFATTDVSYCGQALGLIVVKFKSVADHAATLVEVQYTDVKKPIITIEDAIAADSFFHSLDFQQGSVAEAFDDPEAVIV